MHVKMEEAASILSTSILRRSNLYEPVSRKRMCFCAYCSIRASDDATITLQPAADCAEVLGR